MLNTFCSLLAADLGDIPAATYLVGAVVLVFIGFLLVLVRRYKRCPSNKVLVIYGKVGGGQSSRCLHGGGAFVWPLIQDFDYLSLDPMQIEIPLRGALSMENIRGERAQRVHRGHRHRRRGHAERGDSSSGPARR